MRGRGRRKRPRLSPLTFHLLWPGALTAAVTVALMTKAHFYLLPAYLLAVNIATLAAYRLDKAAARRSWRRIPERALHVLAFAGGTPAAFFAQRYWRHKTIKASFQVRFWMIVVAQSFVAAVWVLKWLLK